MLKFRICLLVRDTDIISFVMLSLEIKASTLLLQSDKINAANNVMVVINRLICIKFKLNSSLIILV